MKFRTEYKVESGRSSRDAKGSMCEGFVIDTRRPVVMLGSCFADNISGRMRGCLWEAENPLGTLYNPMSIAEALDVCLFDSGLAGASGGGRFGDRPSISSGSASGGDWKSPVHIGRYGAGASGGGRFGDRPSMSGFEGSLFEAGGMWRSWLFDSKMAAERREDVVDAFERCAVRMAELLARAEVLFVTFGTAWCYYLKGKDKGDGTARLGDSGDGAPLLGEAGGYLVANCHKQPAGMFERRRLTVGEIVERWTELIGRLRERYPGLRVVFTVSPVRHLKDGFEGNARSKAVLLLATEELCRSVESCSYFPAYEIVNDDLRDYRFYATDLVHPSEECVEYVWEKFREMYVDSYGQQRLKEGESIRKGLEHRPLPNATREPSESAVRREEERLAALRKRFTAFVSERR